MAAPFAGADAFPRRHRGPAHRLHRAVATAIANAESRAAVTRPLTSNPPRHVATLVAQGASPQTSRQSPKRSGRLFPSEASRWGAEPDDTVTTVASWSTAGRLTGLRWPTEGTNVAWIVLQTGGGRIDDFERDRPDGVAARETGLQMAVGVRLTAVRLISPPDRRAFAGRDRGEPRVVHRAGGDSDRELLCSIRVDRLPGAHRVGRRRSAAPNRAQPPRRHAAATDRARSGPAARSRHDASRSQRDGRS